MHLSLTLLPLPHLEVDARKARLRLRALQSEDTPDEVLLEAFAVLVEVDHVDDGLDAPEVLFLLLHRNEVLDLAVVRLFLTTGG